MAVLDRVRIETLALTNNGGRIVFQAVWQNRVSRWAAIFMAVNGWWLFTMLLKYSDVHRSMTIWPDAGEVQPYFNPETRELVHYRVDNVLPSEIAQLAGWPGYDQLCGLAILNMAMFAWLVRLSLSKGATQPPHTKPVDAADGGRNSVSS